MLSFGMHCCKSLIQLIGQVHYIRLSLCLSHENALHTAIWCWMCFQMFSVSTYHRWQMISSWRKVSLPSSLQIMLGVCWTVKVVFFLLPTVPCILIHGSFEAIVIAHCAQWSQMFQDKSQYQYVHLKLCILEIPVSGLLP